MGGGEEGGRGRGGVAKGGVYGDPYPIYTYFQKKKEKKRKETRNSP